MRALTPHIGAAVIDSRTASGSECWRRPRGRRSPAIRRRASCRTPAAEVLLGCAGATTLRLDIVQPPGRRAMDAAAFLRGRGG